MNKGYVHIYTGNGKGKTTSSIGLMVRAAGEGLNIYFGQFMKGGQYNEIRMLKERFPEVTIEQYGGNCLVAKEASEDDKQMAKDGIMKAKQAINSGKYNMVVLDEINVAAFLELISIDDIIEIIKTKPESLELVLTGRYADDKVIELADLVSEVMQVKHYFNDGVPARKGIEL